MTALTPEQKSSVYTVSYVDHLGNKMISAPKTWISDFQVDKEAGQGKTDLNFSLVLNQNEGPSPLFRDWLINDLLVEVHH